MSEVVLYWVVLIALSIPLGAYMARVYEGRARIAQKVIGPIERALYRLIGVRPEHEQSWQRYAIALLLFNILGLLLVYVLQRLQPIPVDPKVAWSTATSFATNTNWQAYSGETTMTNFT